MAKVSGVMFIVPVRDIDKAVRFYRDTFGLEEVFRGDQIAFVGVPGTESAIGLLHEPSTAGAGPQNIGFSPRSLDHTGRRPPGGRAGRRERPRAGGARARCAVRPHRRP